MNARIVLVLATLFSAACSTMSADPATVSDPDHAAVAAVDRFSKAAGHLQVRTADNGLPGPNAPVDFDAGPFITHGLSPEGKPVHYYNFDVQDTTPAPVYVLYREGEAQPVAGQLDIVDTLPGDAGYNDFRQVWKVTVPHGYVANTLTDAAALRKSGYRAEKTEAVRNMPIVPDGSVARARLNGGDARLQRAWYQGKVAKFFAFDETHLTAGGTDSVPISPISVFFNVNPDQPNGGPASGFRTEPGSKQTHNVVSSLPGTASYSPLWIVSVYDTADWPSVHDQDSVLQAKLLAPSVATVNCPIVLVTK